MFNAKLLIDLYYLPPCIAEKCTFIINPVWQGLSVLIAARLPQSKLTGIRQAVSITRMLID